MTVDQLARLPLRGPEPRAHRGRRSTTSPPSTVRRNGFDRPGDADRGGRTAGARTRAGAPVAVDDLPPVDRATGRRPGGGRGARLHGVDPRGLARRARSHRRVGGRCAREPPPSCRSSRPGLAAIADEMGAVLRRAAFSPNIKERADCSAALFTAVGRAARPGRAHPRAPRLHAGVGRGRHRHSAARPARRQVVLNDPFAGGTHLNDLTLVSPVFELDGRLVGWVANRAHHADVGGTAPGSMPPDALTDRRGGSAPPADALRRRGRATGSSPRRARRTSGAATSTRSAARTSSVPRRSAEIGARSATSPCWTRSLDYGERRMRAAIGDAARRSLASSPTCSTPPARARSSRPRPESS